MGKSRRVLDAFGVLASFATVLASLAAILASLATVVTSLVTIFTGLAGAVAGAVTSVAVAMLESTSRAVNAGVKLVQEVRAVSFFGVGGSALGTLSTMSTL